MRKQEYIHTHALLAEVTRRLIERETLPVETLSAYDALETRPSSIHRSKEDHREAVMTLTDAIESRLTETHGDGPERTVYR